MKRVVVVLVLAGVVSAVLLVLHPAAAAPGELDPTFGTAGTVTTPIGKDALLTALALQPDGKIVAAGTSDSSFALARYSPSGLLDPGFGSGGTVSGPRGNGAAISLQADGKILFGGGQFIESRGARVYFTLARFQPDGRLDTSFADGGLFTGPEGRVSDVAVQSDGKILLAGASAYGFELVRLESDGTPDTGFGSAGAVHTLHGANAGASAILVQPSGKIVAAGASTPGTAPPPPPPPPAPPPPPPPGPPPEPFRITLVRYDADGSIDSTFGSAGFSDTSLGYSARADDAVLEPDGKMLVVGPTDEHAYGPRRLFVARYAPDGTPDATLGSGGVALTDIQPGGWRTWMARRAGRKDRRCGSVRRRSSAPRRNAGSLLRKRWRRPAGPGRGACARAPAGRSNRGRWVHANPGRGRLRTESLFRQSPDHSRRGERRRLWALLVRSRNGARK